MKKTITDQPAALQMPKQSALSLIATVWAIGTSARRVPCRPKPRSGDSAPDGEHPDGAARPHEMMGRWGEAICHCWRPPQGLTCRL